MRIMLVNDDGYHAVGIQTLGRALIEAGHQVTVCAPDRERSAAGHSFTFSKPITAEEFSENGVTGYAIGGTPADCASLGLHLLDYQVDMVISGINHGPNLGGACIYSGTANAAIQASMGGVPAMAVSLGDFKKQYNFEAAAKVALKVMDIIKDHPLEMGEIYNLNVPDVVYEEIKGVRPATLSNDFLCPTRYTKLDTEDGSNVYKVVFGSTAENTDPECDTVLVANGWATLSVLTCNMVPKRDVEIPEIGL